jgi:hypothetical protein
MCTSGLKITIKVVEYVATFYDIMWYWGRFSCKEMGYDVMLTSCPSLLSKVKEILELCLQNKDEAFLGFIPSFSL